MVVYLEKKAQRAVTSGNPDLNDYFISQGCAPLGLEVVIEPSPRPLAWAIESRPFGPQNAGVCCSFTSNPRKLRNFKSLCRESRSAIGTYSGPTL
jgi:hypothetical protein